MKLLSISIIIACFIYVTLVFGAVVLKDSDSAVVNVSEHDFVTFCIKGVVYYKFQERGTYDFAIAPAFDRNSKVILCSKD